MQPIYVYQKIEKKEKRIEKFFAREYFCFISPFPLKALNLILRYIYGTLMIGKLSYFEC